MIYLTTETSGYGDAAAYLNGEQFREIAREFLNIQSVLKGVARLGLG